MTTLAVVAYPTLEHPDRDCIEAVRARHDPQASRIAAHFTLVFPVEMPPVRLLAHVSTVLAGCGRIVFTVRGAEVVCDVSGEGGLRCVKGFSLEGPNGWVELGSRGRGEGSGCRLHLSCERPDP